MTTKHYFYCVVVAAFFTIPLGCSDDESDDSLPAENSAELCADGVDNDGDGAIDCADGGCFTQPFCVAATTAGSDTDSGAGNDPSEWIIGEGVFVSPVEDPGADCALSGAIPSSYSNDLLPDPFMKLDGTRISKKSEWLCQRKELETLVGHTAHSMKPGPPESVSGTVSDTSISVNVTDGGSTVSFSASVSLDGCTKPCPAIIAAGMSSLDGSILGSEGVATINFDHQGMCDEKNQSGTFSQLYGTEHSCQVAWSWGVSRIIDVLEQNPGTIDPTALGTTGCSRNGKAAWGMGAWDQRIALTIPQEGGTGGIASWRMANTDIPGDNNGGEGPQTLASCCSEASGWFGPNMCGGASYRSNPNAMPADAHFMGAMYAPRGILILDNPYIGWLCPMCGHVAALAAREVYKALGYEKNFYYFSAGEDGTHCQFQSESEEMLREAIRAFLTRTAAPNGRFEVGTWATNASGELSDWIDWETPTLQ